MLDDAEFVILDDVLSRIYCSNFGITCGINYIGHKYSPKILLKLNHRTRLLQILNNKTFVMTLSD